MPTVLSHAVLGFAATSLVAGRRADGRVLAAGTLAAALPDADAPVASLLLGRSSGLLDHRGVTHGLLFAAVLGVLVALLFLRRRPLPWWRGAVAVVVAVTLHDVLDALTDGGAGVAFLAPFSDDRIFLPCRPIPVAPLGLRGLLTPYGGRLLLWEGLWLVAPALGLALLARWAASRAGRPRPPEVSGPRSP